MTLRHVVTAATFAVVPAEVADKWIEAGWVSEAKEPAKRAAKAAPPKRTR